MLQAKPPHHPPAYRCAIATTCAQGILRPLRVALAGMAVQDLSKRMSAEYLCWVLGKCYRLADLPLT